jgi:hypothetical protein
MPKADDRVARALARTQDVEAIEEEQQQPSPRSPARRSVKSAKKSERVIIHDNEMDIDKVVQRVRDRMSSPKPPASEKNFASPSPRVLMEERRSSRHSSYVERPSPRSPTSLNKLPIREDIVTTEIIPEPADKRVSEATLSYLELKRSTRDELSNHLRDLNSEQLRNEILKLRSERLQSERELSRNRPSGRTNQSETRQSNKISRNDREGGYPEEKIPVYDEETGTYVLWSKSKLEKLVASTAVQFKRDSSIREDYDQPVNVSKPPRIQPPLIRRATTRDAYPTKTRDYDQPTATIVTINPEMVEQSTDIDFDNMTDVQRREFLSEMKIKFAVFKKNFSNFPIPVIQDDDSPKWVFGIYEQLLDMAKTDASQPVYQTGLQVIFLILQVVLTISGIPAKNFFSFHAKNFSKYNTLMAELGEKWGPIIDITSSIETKLAIAIGWNTLVFAIVSVVAARFGERWGTTAEKLLDQLTTSNVAGSKMQDLERQLDGRAPMEGDSEEPTSSNSGGSSNDPLGGLGGIANLLGGLLGNGSGGASNGGGGLGGILGSLLGGSMNSGSQGSAGAASTERRPPVYDD